MPYLVDTNVLLRSTQPAHPMHATAQAAIRNLRAQGETLRVAAQNLMEFWRVATRPRVANGLGLSIGQAEAVLATLEGSFTMAPDTAAVYPEWRRLVVAYGVAGVQVHDARLVAVMKGSGIAHLLTFNGADFNRYSAGEGITVVDPANVPASLSANGGVSANGTPGATP